MTKFSFQHMFFKDGSWDHTTIYFKNNKYIETDIESDTFKDDPNMTKYLYSKKTKEHFPKIWKLGGEIQKLPPGKRRELHRKILLLG